MAKIVAIMDKKKDAQNASLSFLEGVIFLT